MTKLATDIVRWEDIGATDYLAELGTRVRSARAQRGMTRKALARDSGVSERYLAKLETGQGNVSVLVLRQIARAMDMTAADLIAQEAELSPKRQTLQQLSAQLAEADVVSFIDLMRAKLSVKSECAKGRRISLIGLRGAGKSTLGPRLASQLGFGFVELNAEIEKEFGASLAEIFSLAGQPSFRRYEQRCLAKIVETQDNVVIATGGSIVADDQTFSLLLERTHVVWLQAAPEEHMARVVAQGDMRPMAGSREAMADLKQILQAREPLYERAEAYCNTSGQSVEESLRDLKTRIGEMGMASAK
ncbi:MAG: transcriptional regulator [Sneathiella sp.]|nr:MAG: transcriptional regulator [Sneathiella sp.]